MKKFLFYIITNLFIISLFAQYPQNFYPPLKGTLKLSGNYAELRKNHFHTGLDFSINRQVGLPVYAVADGYVSRIKVSSRGYGNVVYINHPNGYKSVYAHLSRFNNQLTHYIRQMQYEIESYEVDLYPDTNKLTVKKGEIIGYTGNSGRSFGAHLHFEMRTWDDVPINPQLFGFRIYDNIKPKIKTIAIYPATDTSLVNFRHSKTLKTVQTVNGKYHLQPPLVVYGAIYLGIETYDYINYTNARNAIYSVKLYADDTLIMAYHFEKIPFEDNRAVNTFVDYKLRNTSSHRIQRCIKEPGNPLPIYDSIRNNGILNFRDNEYHVIKFVVSDIKGNTRSIDFQIKSTIKMQKYALKAEKPDFVIHLKYDTTNYFDTSLVKLFFEKNTFYKDTGLIFKILPKKKNAFSRTFLIGDYFIPLHKYYYIYVKADSVPVRLRDKMIIVKENFKGKIASCGGYFKNGYIEGKTREFGKFYLLADTVAPKILPLANYKNANLKGYSKMKFKVTDNLSGIKFYYVIVNGNWDIIEYDEKNNLFTYRFNKAVKGKNTFIFRVYDERKNIAEYKTVFYR